MSTIWQIKNNDRKSVSRDIKTLLDAAKATDWLGNKDAPVILKPNLVVAKPAAGGATTHPEVAAAVIEYLQDAGYSSIQIAEGSWVGASTSDAFRVCGYNKLSQRYDVKLIDLQKDDYVSMTAGGESFKVCRTIAELDSAGGRMINLPVLKGHGQTRLTCALKNLKGCIPDSEKRRYHSLGVHRPVALLNSLIQPAFALVDGLNGDPSWEEGGSPQKRDLLLLGRDPVSVDSFACRLLGIRESAVEYIAIARDSGIGVSFSESDIIMLNSGASFSVTAPAQSEKPDEIKKWIDSIVVQKSACSACFGNLASALRELYAEVPDAASSLKPSGILIGQDFRGAPAAEGKIGIGTCTATVCKASVAGSTGYSSFINGCPPSKSDIKDFLIQVKK